MAAVLGGEVLGAVLLWIAGIVSAMVGIAPFGGAQQWVWLPWTVDGVWALVGAIGWGYLVCTLVGRLVAARIESRGYGRPAAGWLRISIAVSGYGGMAVGHTPGAHVVTAVVAGAVVIRLVAFNLDGSLRPWRWTAPSRVQLVGALLAAIVGLSYSGLHAFAADGSGGTYNTGAINAHVGHTETVMVGLSHLRLPAAITGVTLTGPGATHVTASGLVISPNSSVELIPAKMRSWPGAKHFRGFVWHPTPLPYQVGAGEDVWINMDVKLAACGDVTLNTLKLRYTVLGISTGETIPLQQPLTLSCAP